MNRLHRTIKLSAILASMAVLAMPALAAKKPSPPPQADPQVTFVANSAINVANQDGSVVTAVYKTRDALLHEPQLTADRRSVVFIEWGPGLTDRIRRTRFEVTGGKVVTTETLTLLEMGITPKEITLSPSGERVAFVIDNWSLRELLICELPPCSAADVRVLFEPPPGRYVQPIGGYSANESAYFFVESGEIGIPAEIRRIDLGDEPPPAGETLLELPGLPTTLDPGRVDLGGLESRLLFDLDDHLFVFDTSTRLTAGLGAGHAATWSPDESAVIFVESWRYVNSRFGPLLRRELLTTSTTKFYKYGADPNWR